MYRATLCVTRRVGFALGIFTLCAVYSDMPGDRSQRPASQDGVDKGARRPRGWGLCCAVARSVSEFTLQATADK